MIKIKTIGQLLDYVETEEKASELIKYINQLQSNWNSLREWFEEKDNNGFEKFYIEDVLYKMNELEGANNENNNI